MNNSAEAEKPKTDEEFFNDWQISYFGEEQRPTRLPDHIHDLMKAYHNFAREKELASLTDVFKEAIYELWMYSGGEDQSSEIRKKLEKYHKITGMPWPEGELKYKPKVK